MLSVRTVQNTNTQKPERTISGFCLWALKVTKLLIKSVPTCNMRTLPTWNSGCTRLNILSRIRLLNKLWTNWSDPSSRRLTNQTSQEFCCCSNSAAFTLTRTFCCWKDSAFLPSSLPETSTITGWLPRWCASRNRTVPVAERRESVRAGLLPHFLEPLLQWRVQVLSRLLRRPPKTPISGRQLHLLWSWSTRWVCESQTVANDAKQSRITQLLSPENSRVNSCLN